MRLSNFGRTTTVLYGQKETSASSKRREHSQNVQKYVVNDIRFREVENRVLKGQ